MSSHAGGSQGEFLLEAETFRLAIINECSIFLARGNEGVGHTYLLYNNCRQQCGAVTSSYLEVVVHHFKLQCVVSHFVVLSSLELARTQGGATLVTTGPG